MNITRAPKDNNMEIDEKGKAKANQEVHSDNKGEHNPKGWFINKYGYHNTHHPNPFDFPKCGEVSFNKAIKHHTYLNNIFTTNDPPSNKELEIQAVAFIQRKLYLIEFINSSSGYIHSTYPKLIGLGMAQKKYITGGNASCSQGENPRPIDIDGRTKQKITLCIAIALNITLHRPYFLYTRQTLQSTVSCLKAEGGKSQRKSHLQLSPNNE
ncbi:hypothetical protein GOBAR_AA38001 [Gossypium barbadense]|uniref:Uncharacterized protein n=1 Tax=Gossypium barbadense TaxID=3634 RepID=A0A2P5VV42_GOSBA|nr:hypothetical protein GOBAR_AA38001 [Gossypium barbadense]